MQRSFTYVLCLATLLGLATARRAVADPTAFGSPVNATGLNTSYADRSPSLTADGLEVFFASDRTGSQGYDIWYASRGSTDLPFGAPQNLASVNSPGNDVSPRISRDGLTLYFTRGWTGHTQSYDVYAATRPDRSSTFSVPVPVAEVNSAGSDGDAFLSADGLSLYFDIDAGAGAPGEDLYVARRPNTSAPFGTPTRIAELCTDGNDREPWVSSDELTMFFTSDRLEAGHFSIYQTSRASRSDPWGPATLVGSINSSYGDGGPSYDEARQLLYFNSGRPGGQGGALDIWVAQVVPALDVQSGGDIDFGSVLVGKAKEVAEAFVAKNTGGGTLGVSVSADAPFHVLDDGGLPTDKLTFSLGPKEERTIGLDFAPMAAQAYSKIVSLTSNGGGTTRTAKGTGVLVLLPSISIVATYPTAVETTAAEPPSTGQFAISRTGDTTTALKVYFAVSGTARNGKDYTLSAPSPVTIAAGQTSVAITVWPKDDPVYQGDRTVRASVVANAAYWIDSANNTATVTIKDNEPTVSIEATDKDAAEPAETGTFTVTATRPSGLSAPAVLLKVPFGVSGTAKMNGDFTLSPGSPVTVIIPAGAASGKATITVTPKDDLLAEGPETSVLKLGKGTTYGLMTGKDSASVTIADDEPVPTVLITSWPAQVARGAKITIGWTVSGGSAGTTNRVEWGTDGIVFAKATGSDRSVPYQATFTAPTTPGIVYLRVHMMTTGGLHCCSDVQQVLVP